MRAKPYDIQWPVTGKTVEDINANFDAAFHSLNTFEQRMASSLSIVESAHEILSATHSDSVTANRIRGDILTAQGVTPKWTRLAKGSLGTVLTMGANESAWADPAHVVLSAIHTDTLVGTVVRGDVIIGNATPKWSRLAKGTATYVLTAGASDVSWAAPVVQTSALLSAVHTDTTPAAVVRGDVIVGIGGTPKWERLAKGTTGYFFKATAADAEWAAHGLTYGDVGAAPLAHVHAWGDITSGVPTTWTPIAHNLLSAYHGDTTASAVARGDMIIGSTATPKWTALAKSTAGFVLTMGAEEPAWAAPAAPAAHQLDGAVHTVSGLTSGHFLKATAATTFAFAAHGLGYGDVGAAAASHVHAWGDITSGVPTTWAPIAHNVLSAYHGDSLADNVIRGDVMIGNATPKWSRLAKGTATHVLTMGADDPVWAALPAFANHNLLSTTHPDTLAHPCVRGDLIVGDASATPLWAAFAVGGAGTFLKSNGTDPSWGAIASTELSDTAGLARLAAANSFTLINPLTTIAESWIGPSSTTGIYFKGGNVGIATAAPIYQLHITNKTDKTNTDSMDTIFLSSNEAAAGKPFGLLTFIIGGASAGVRSAVLQTLEYGLGYDGVISLQPFGGKVRTALGAFAAGDKYVIADAAGNLHVSALGPAS